MRKWEEDKDQWRRKNNCGPQLREDIDHAKDVERQREIESEEMLKQMEEQDNEEAKQKDEEAAARHWEETEQWAQAGLPGHGPEMEDEDAWWDLDEQRWRPGCEWQPTQASRDWYQEEGGDYAWEQEIQRKQEEYVQEQAEDEEQRRITEEIEMTN